MLFSLKKMRPAIAMIELIFSMVIIAIAMMSAPMLISTATKSSLVTMQQESIAAAVSQMNMILSSQWDHFDTNESVGTPILTTASAVLTACTGGENFPIGVTADGVGGGRYCIKPDSFITVATQSSDILAAEHDAGEVFGFNDIDDYNGEVFNITVYNAENYTTAVGDYIDKDITITSSVSYIDDNPRDNGNLVEAFAQTTNFSNPFRNNIGTTSNIKMLSVQLASSNIANEVGSKQINLSAFMCNIGSANNILSNEGSL